MNILLNGRPTQQPQGASIADLVESICGSDPQGVAVAQNGSIVRRSQWSGTPAKDGDEIEILRATSGG
jgi:sulfur carrier protein